VPIDGGTPNDGSPCRVGLVPKLLFLFGNAHLRNSVARYFAVVGTCCCTLTAGWEGRNATKRSFEDSRFPNGSLGNRNVQSAHQGLLRHTACWQSCFRGPVGRSRWVRSSVGRESMAPSSFRGMRPQTGVWVRDKLERPDLGPQLGRLRLQRQDQSSGFRLSHKSTGSGGPALIQLVPRLYEPPALERRLVIVPILH
jgi:hypothetical protein